MVGGNADGYLALMSDGDQSTTTRGRTMSWRDAAGRAAMVAVVFAVVDAAILIMGDVSATMTIVLVATMFMTVGLVTMIILLATQALVGRYPASARPNHVVTLIALLVVGVMFVRLNDATFSGEGLARSGFAEVVRGVATVGVMVAVLVAMMIHGGWSARRNRRRRGDNCEQERGDRSLRDFAWPITLVVVATLLSIADRTVLPSQYPQVHLQLFLTAWATTTMATAALGRRFLSRHVEKFAVVAVILLVASPLVVLFMLRSDRADATAGLIVTRSSLHARHLLEMIPRAFLADDTTDIDFDRARYFAPRRPDAERLRTKRESLALIAPANIVVVSIDTVRADHCGFLGYERPTTSEWGALAARGAVFERAYTSYPTSDIAFSSMLHSLWPAETPAAKKTSTTASLPSVFRSAGYATHAVTSFLPMQCRPGSGFGTFVDGFDSFEATGESNRQADAVRVVDRAIEVMTERASTSQPFLLWIHVFDPHDPYFERSEFGFGDDPIARYDSEIAYASRAIGKLDDAMKRLGLTDRSYVVTHSDHGEAFGEHGGAFHNSSLYEEQIRVPFVVVGPGVAPVRCRETVSLVDLLPTLVSLTGVKDEDASRRRGRDLSSLLWGLRPDGDPGAFAFAQLLLKFYRSGKKAVLIEGDRKVIHTPEGLPRWEVYDLAEDPEESENRVGRVSRDEATMKAAVRAMMGALN